MSTASAPEPARLRLSIRPDATRELETPITYLQEAPPSLSMRASPPVRNGEHLTGACPSVDRQPSYRTRSLSRTEADRLPARPKTRAAEGSGQAAPCPFPAPTCTAPFPKTTAAQDLAF